MVVKTGTNCREESNKGSPWFDSSITNRHMPFLTSVHRVSTRMPKQICTITVRRMESPVSQYLIDLLSKSSISTSCGSMVRVVGRSRRNQRVESGPNKIHFPSSDSPNSSMILSKNRNTKKLSNTLCFCKLLGCLATSVDVGCRTKSKIAHRTFPRRTCLLGTQQ